MIIVNKKVVLFFIYFSLGIVASFIILFSFTYNYVFSEDFDSSSFNDRLIYLAKQSIVSKDVPVASILIYDNKIIGEGNNDVLKNNNPSGHAEINAIKDCFKKIGVKKFNSLDRKKLILLTTFEPCPMCKGAIQEYKINNVIFNLAKGKKEKIIYLKNDISYYINLRQTKNKRIQYNLFKLHPAFDSIKYPY